MLAKRITPPTLTLSEHAVQNMANYYYLLLVVVELISSLGDALLLFAISGHYQQRRFRAEWLRFVHLRGHDMTSLGRRCRQQRYILKNDLVAVTDRLIRESSPPFLVPLVGWGRKIARSSYVTKKRKWRSLSHRALLSLEDGLPTSLTVGMVIAMAGYLYAVLIPMPCSAAGSVLSDRAR